MTLFNAVVDSSFGNFVMEGWEDAIVKFCASYRALPNITFPPKYHMVEAHLKEFLERRWAQNAAYEGYGLGYWSEQQFEAVHNCFNNSWDRYKVGKDHETRTTARGSSPASRATMPGRSRSGGEDMTTFGIFM